MKQFEAKNIKNVALLGHGGCGKTTLCEAMLKATGALERLGNVADGTTVSDYDPEEKKRKVSVSSSIVPVVWKDTKINIIDAPGLFDFQTGVCEALRACETAIIVLSGKSGLNVGSEKAFRSAAKRHLKKIFFINKLNSDHADFYKVVDTLKATYGNVICPVVIPYVVDHKVLSYTDLITGTSWKYENGKSVQCEMPDFGETYDNMHRLLCESVASVDEELMEKFFSGEEFTSEEIMKGLKIGVDSGEIAPVYCGAGQTCEGIDLMLYSMVHIFPSADEARLEKAKDKNGNETEVHCHANGRLAAIVFKTVADPFVGKMSYFKVISGTLRSNSVAFNPRTGENERIGKLMFVRGGKTEDTDYVVAGDIGAVSKLSGIGTGDTLTSPDNPLELEGIEFQKPTVTMAIYPANKGEEDKISSAVKKMVEEDPALKLFHDHETHEYTVSGLGEQQLDVLLSRLKTRYGVDATLQTPKTAYRETIQKKVKVQGRYKKQSGGHGQFGDVWIEFEPCDSDTLVFEEKIFGGSVPKNFFPAVEKGLQESVKKGVLAGYPVVGLKATLVDGSYHPVDSSEMSFKTAASLAYKAGLEQASPVLLEPIGILKASVPDDYMGDIIGDINKRRGRVLGMEPTEDGYQEISANIPVSESYDFSTALRSITQGRGSFTFEFERYERAPENVAQKIIENSNKE